MSKRKPADRPQKITLKPRKGGVTRKPAPRENATEKEAATDGKTD